jgi:hypothetical protein
VAAAIEKVIVKLGAINQKANLWGLYFYYQLKVIKN